MIIIVIVILLALIHNTHAIGRKLDKIIEGLNSIKDQNNQVEDH